MQGEIENSRYSSGVLCIVSTRPDLCPPWMGLEIAGEIIELGAEVSRKSAWAVGDLVCALLGGGGYAEHVAVNYDMLMPIPRGLTMEEAFALPEAYATSYLNLFLEGHLEAGQTAFIPAGASGLASVAIPMAKAFGARVITSVLSDEIAEKIRPLLTRGIHIVGSMLRNRAPSYKAYILSQLVEHVWPKIESGEIRPSIYRILPMEQAQNAHGILERCENVGKVVLTMNH